MYFEINPIQVLSTLLPATCDLNLQRIQIFLYDSKLRWFNRREMIFSSLLVVVVVILMRLVFLTAFIIYHCMISGFSIRNLRTRPFSLIKNMANLQVGCTSGLLLLTLLYFIGIEF